MSSARLLPNMQVGDLIIGSHLIQFDMDLSVLGRCLGEMLGQDRMIESDPVLVTKCAEAFDSAFQDQLAAPNLMIGTIVSSDRFIADAETHKWLQQEFSALATEMEGAGVGYTGKLNNVPFVAIRGLSDTAGDSANADFAANLKLVCKNSFAMIGKVVSQLSV